MIASKKYIAWDWNGTLLDDTDITLESGNKMFKYLNLPSMDVDTFRQKYVMPLKTFYNNLGIGIGEERFEDARHAFFEHYEPLVETTSLRTGAVEILEQTKQNQVTNIIVSNHVIDQINILLQRHNIQDYFEDVVAFTGYGTEHRQLSKGEKLKLYVDDHSLHNGDMMIVGDTIEEIEIAKELDMTSVAITGGLYSEERLRTLKPDYLIHSLGELKPILVERGFVS
jgi:phosphoglycolate phosphatase